MAKFWVGESIPRSAVETVRLGAGSGVGYGNEEVGKLVKLVNVSGKFSFQKCAAGDMIEGVITSVEQGLYDGFSIGGVSKTGRLAVKCDGSQAAGTGSLAIGDWVVAGDMAAVGTAESPYPKVRKATNQPGAVPADLTAAGAQAKVAAYGWRVLALENPDTGATTDGSVGTYAVIERVSF